MNSPSLGWPGGLEWRKAPTDSRHLPTGAIIPAGAYADQPYIVKTADGAWLCVVTTGSGHEGAPGQHVVSLRSTDQGQTWSYPLAIESDQGPEASWAVPFATPRGRLFVFYVYNADNIRELPADDPPIAGGVTRRMDSHGHYVFRWSDDHGRSWSPQRVTIPVREFEIDRQNSTGGKVRLFWNVGRPVVVDGKLVLPLHKVGGFGAGWFTRSEGAFVCSPDLATVEDPAQASWITLPDGDHGLRTPAGGGPVAEEQCLTVLSDGSLFCVYRTIDGHPAGAYSRDAGHTWSAPRYLAYADGSFLKHSRAACFVWKLGDSYALWFHNHGGRFIGEHPHRADLSYEDRNPAWMCRGVEVQTPRGLELAWEAPEIVLYDDDPGIRMSYPDIVEESDALFVTETQKAIARVHRLSPSLTAALRHGPDAFAAAKLRQEAVLHWQPNEGADEITLPALPVFLGRMPEPPYGVSDFRHGFSLEFVVDSRKLDGASTLAEASAPAFGGFRLLWCPDRKIKIELSDGRTEVSWSCDADALREPGLHHIVIVVDGGARVISFICDGHFNDGVDERQFGWGRFSPFFRGLISHAPLRVPNSSMQSLRLYPRALLTTEARALHHHSTP